MSKLRLGRALLPAAAILLTDLAGVSLGDTLPATPTLADAAATATGPATAAAATTPIDTGSVGWILTSAALVCFMIPGLAMFYGGMVRAKNVLNTFFGCMACLGVVGLIWIAYGYATSFQVMPNAMDANGKEVLNDKGEVAGPAPSYFPLPDSKLMFLRGQDGKGAIGSADSYGSQLTSGDTTNAKQTGIPELAFFAFQGMFAIITPALIFGAVVERIRIGPFLVFVALWSTFVYLPVAHWVWNPAGWLFQKGVMDFAGGTVVHILGGFSALALTLVLGKRKGYEGVPFAPHSVGMTLLGAGFLMVGWFGFNAGSAIGIPGSELPVAGTVASLAFVTTMIAACVAALSWTLVEWTIAKKPTNIGFASGLVAGLVAITPCAGHVTPGSAVIIGGLAGIVCFFGCRLKHLFKADDSLDVFGVHGIGGLLGALMVGILAIRPLSGGNTPGGMEQFMKQLQGAGAAAVYAFVLSLILAFALKYTIGLRVKPEQEDMGLDVAVHGEEGYKLS
jgi:Amt family ammonium transporter